MSTFIIKSYLEKDLKSIATNVAMYLTPTKKEKYPTPPIYRNKQWVYCLKTIESEKFHDVLLLEPQGHIRYLSAAFTRMLIYDAVCQDQKSHTRISSI